MVYPKYIIVHCADVSSILKISLLKVAATCADESENPLHNSRSILHFQPANLVFLMMISTSTGFIHKI